MPALSTNVAAIQLRGVCRSHSDPGLEHAGEKVTAGRQQGYSPVAAIDVERQALQPAARYAALAWLGHSIKMDISDIHHAVWLCSVSICCF